MSYRNAAQRSAFDEWVDAMREWQREIGAVTDPSVVLAEKFAETASPEIAHGHYAGERRWESVAEIPSGEIRDELLRLIVWQGAPRCARSNRHAGSSTARRRSTTASGWCAT